MELSKEYPLKDRLEFSVVARSLVRSTDLKPIYHNAFVDGYVIASCECKSKLHLLQQELESAKIRNKELSELYHSLLTKYNGKEQEYDKLKMQSELNYEVLMSEFKVLKERAEKMEMVLIEISGEPYSYGEVGCTWGDSQYDSISAAAGYNQAIDNVSKKAHEALSSYNTNNQNENNEGKA